MVKKTLIGTICWLLVLALNAQDTLDFRTIDNRLLELYEHGEWDSLKSEGESALEQGMDYYYLRMRLGIARFETANYLQAIPHFTRALDFNPKDPVAMEYLYQCHLSLNQFAEARKVLSDCPASLRERLSEEYPVRENAVGAEAGILLSNQETVIQGKNLDGSDNLYGEADILKDGYFASAWVTGEISPRIKSSLMYTFFALDKAMMVAENNNIRLRHDYQVNQHQVYLGASVSLGDGFFVHPAFHYIRTGLDRWEYNTGIDGSVNLAFSRATLDSYIGFLALSKDFGLVRPMIFGGMSWLNEAQQYQGGFRAAILPFGNLNFYLTTTLTGHQDEGHINLVIDQLLGFKIARPVWLEASASFGKMSNYYEDFASIVYNIPDEIRFKEKTRLIVLISPAVRLTLEYDYLIRRDDVVYYESQWHFGWSAVARHKSKIYNNQYLSGGLIWKF